MRTLSVCGGGAYNRPFRSFIWRDPALALRAETMSLESANHMTRRFLGELKDGDLVEEVYFVADRQLRANRNAALYLSADLRDRSGTINARLWNVTETSCEAIQPGIFARIRGKVQVYQGALQLILSHITPVSSEGLDPADFEQGPAQNVEALFAELQTAVATVQSPWVSGLLRAFLSDPAIVAGLQELPAGVKAHHAYRGGLLEHIVSLMRVTLRVCEVYAQLNRDEMIAAVVLHDIGKLRELQSEGGFSYTDEGQLLGHLVIGVEMLSEKIRVVEAELGAPCPAELVWRLKHLIVSHHGTYEFGSPRLPMTPEAMAFHLLDNLDAKVHEFTQTIAADPNAGAHWTLYQPRLERKLFKGAPVEQPPPS